MKHFHLYRMNHMALFVPRRAIARLDVPEPETLSAATVDTGTPDQQVPPVSGGAEQATSFLFRLITRDPQAKAPEELLSGVRDLVAAMGESAGQQEANPSETSNEPVKNTPRTQGGITITRREFIQGSVRTAVAAGLLALFAPLRKVFGQAADDFEKGLMSPEEFRERLFLLVKKFVDAHQKEVIAALIPEVGELPEELQPEPLSEEEVAWLKEELKDVFPKAPAKGRESFSDMLRDPLAETGIGEALTLAGDVVGSGLLANCIRKWVKFEDVGVEHWLGIGLSLGLKFAGANAEKKGHLLHEWEASAMSFLYMNFFASLFKGMTFEGIDFNKYTREQLGFMMAVLAHLFAPLVTTYGASIMEAPMLRVMTEKMREDGISQEEIHKLVYNLFYHTSNAAAPLGVGDYPFLKVKQELGWIKMILWQVGDGFGVDSMVDEYLFSLVYNVYQTTPEDKTLPLPMRKLKRAKDAIAQVFKRENWKAVGEALKNMVPLRSFYMPPVHMLRKLAHKRGGKDQDDSPEIRQMVETLGADVTQAIMPLLRDMKAMGNLTMAVAMGDTKELVRNALSEIFHPNLLYQTLNKTMREDRLTKQRELLFWERALSHADQTDETLRSEGRLNSASSEQTPNGITLRELMAKTMEEVRQAGQREGETHEQHLKNAIRAFTVRVEKATGISESLREELQREGTEILQTCAIEAVIDNTVNVELNKAESLQRKRIVAETVGELGNPPEAGTEANRRWLESATQKLEEKILQLRPHQLKPYRTVKVKESAIGKLQKIASGTSNHTNGTNMSLDKQAVNITEDRWSAFWQSIDEALSNQEQREAVGVEFEKRVSAVATVLESLRTFPPETVNDTLFSLVAEGRRQLSQCGLDKDEARKAEELMMDLLAKNYFANVSANDTFWKRYRMEIEGKQHMLHDMKNFVGDIVPDFSLSEEKIAGLMEGRYPLNTETVHAVAYAYVANQMDSACNILAEEATHKAIPKDLPIPGGRGMITTSLLSARYFFNPRYIAERMAPFVGTTQADMLKVLLPQMGAIVPMVDLMTRGQVIVDQLEPLTGKARARVYYCTLLTCTISSIAENFTGFVVGSDTEKNLLGPMIGENPLKIKLDHPKLKKFFKVLYMASIFSAASNLLGDFGPQMAFVSQIVDKARGFPGVTESAKANLKLDVITAIYVTIQNEIALREFNQLPEISGQPHVEPEHPEVTVEQLEKLQEEILYLATKGLMEVLERHYAGETFPPKVEAIVTALRQFLPGADPEFTEETVKQFMEEMAEEHVGGGH